MTVLGIEPRTLVLALGAARARDTTHGRTVRDPSDTEDILKVEDFLGGDTRAFEFLFDKYREKVYGIAFRYARNREDALEVTQDVFLRAYLGLAKFKTDSKFFTWLYRITVNRAIDFTRSRRVQPLVGVEASAMDALGEVPGRRSPPPDPVVQAQDKELEERVLESVEQLSEKHRTVFLLHACEDLSYKEIADVVGCSLGTVMSRLFYARKKLQEILAKQGLDIASMRPQTTRPQTKERNER